MFRRLGTILTIVITLLLLVSCSGRDPMDDITAILDEKDIDDSYKQITELISVLDDDQKSSTIEDAEGVLLKVKELDQKIIELTNEQNKASEILQDYNLNLTLAKNRGEAVLMFNYLGITPEGVHIGYMPHEDKLFILSEMSAIRLRSSMNLDESGVIENGMSFIASVREGWEEVQVSVNNLMETWDYITIFEVESYGDDTKSSEWNKEYLNQQYENLSVDIRNATEERAYNLMLADSILRGQQAPKDAAREEYVELPGIDVSMVSVPVIKIIEIADEEQVIDENYFGDDYMLAEMIVNTMDQYYKAWIKFINKGSKDIYEYLYEDGQLYKTISAIKKVNYDEELTEMNIVEYEVKEEYIFVYVKETYKRSFKKREETKRYNRVYKMIQGEEGQLLIEERREL